MLGKRILNRDAERWILCSWDTCDNDGVTLHQARHHDHNPGYPCNAPGTKHPIYVFCSERHKQYWLNSHRSLGNLPAGSRNVL